MSEHWGDWRSGRLQYCSTEDDPDGLHCEHGDETIEADHWSCCGALQEDGPCNGTESEDGDAAAAQQDPISYLLSLAENERTAAGRELARIMRAYRARWLFCKQHARACRAANRIVRFFGLLRSLKAAKHLRLKRRSTNAMLEDAADAQLRALLLPTLQRCGRGCLGRKVAYLSHPAFVQQKETHEPPPEAKAEAVVEVEVEVGERQVVEPSVQEEEEEGEEGGPSVCPSEGCSEGVSEGSLSLVRPPSSLPESSVCDEILPLSLLQKGGLGYGRHAHFEGGEVPSQQGVHPGIASVSVKEFLPFFLGNVVEADCKKISAIKVFPQENAVSYVIIDDDTDFRRKVESEEGLQFPEPGKRNLSSYMIPREKLGVKTIPTLDTTVYFLEYKKGFTPPICFSFIDSSEERVVPCIPPEMIQVEIKVHDVQTEQSSFFCTPYVGPFGVYAISPSLHLLQPCIEGKGFYIFTVTIRSDLFCTCCVDVPVEVYWGQPDEVSTLTWQLVQKLRLKLEQDGPTVTPEVIGYLVKIRVSCRTTENLSTTVTSSTQYAKPTNFAALLRYCERSPYAWLVQLYKQYEFPSLPQPVKLPDIPEEFLKDVSQDALQRASRANYDTFLKRPLRMLSHYTLSDYCAGGVGFLSSGPGVYNETKRLRKNANNIIPWVPAGRRKPDKLQKLLGKVPSKAKPLKALSECDQLSTISDLHVPSGKGKLMPLRSVNC